MLSFLVCALLFAALELFLHRRREKRLAELTLYLTKVQDSLELPDFSGYSEGQLGILQNEICKAVTFLSEQSRRSGRQSSYLADMLSDISHQMKTPLAAITLMADLLRQPGLPEEKRIEFATKIDSQAEKITWLVRNLLVMAQLEADVMKLKKERVEAGELIREALSPLEIFAELREVELSCQVPQGLYLLCDRAWTAEALSNIIKNCIEHRKTPDEAASAPGHVRISVSQSNLATTILIRDDGTGIPAQDLPHIFERFYKGSQASSSSVGIGLAMARQLILLQNGTIEVKSREGEGSVFQIRLYRVASV